MKQLVLTLPLRNLKKKKEKKEKKKTDINMFQKQCIYFHIRFKGFL